jgi:hypothetical protein
MLFFLQNNIPAVDAMKTIAAAIKVGNSGVGEGFVGVGEIIGICLPLDQTFGR